MTKYKRILHSLLGAFLLLCAVLGARSLPFYAARADDTAPADLSGTRVADDLTLLDKLNYPADPDGVLGKRASVINVAEFCYSTNDEILAHYGLYVYFYNPQLVRIDDKSKLNKIEIATAYKSDGAPKDYAKLGLTFCDRTDDRLFYKYKIDDPNNTIINRVKGASVRRYDVAGVELRTVYNSNAYDYAVGATYEYTGFAQWCDGNAESTLTATVTDLFTISLDVRDTVYRLDMGDKTKTKFDQVNSVYFSLDNDIFTTYGDIQGVKAEWYEYKTSPIFVTESDAAYNAMLPFLAKNIGGYTYSLQYAFGVDPLHTQDPTLAMPFEIGYNANAGAGSGSNVGSKTQVSQIDWIFKKSGDDLDDYVVSSEELQNWIKSYNTIFDGEKLPIKDSEIPRALYAGMVDEGHTEGYNVREFDADKDSFDLNIAQSDTSLWDQFLASWGLYKNPVEMKEITPIYKVKELDMLGSDLSGILVDKTDEKDFREYYTDAKNRAQTTCLFRFSVTDYYAAIADTIKYSTNWAGFLEGKSIGQAYMAIDTHFYDFDILTLTFNKDGRYTTIAAVSNPIDIIPDIVPPSTIIPQRSMPWWVWLIIGVGALIVLGAVGWVFKPIGAILKFIGGAAWAIVSSPFKLILWLFKPKGGD